jgi:lantibiotic leader peptide-processing serine protease
MHRSNAIARRATALLSLAALSACSDRVTAPLTQRVAPASRSADVTASAGQYIVLTRGTGFSTSFASTVAALGGSVHALHQGAGIAVVRGLTASAAASLAATSDIAEVDADAVVALDTPIAATKPDMVAVSAGTPGAFTPANAALFSWQWNMRAIQADKAWAAGKLGDPTVTVAILDTGIDYDAFDLNGLVDLSRSTSFVTSDNAVRAQYFPGRNDISDFNGHGTNVATQVSSRAVAFAGVTARTTLIGVKVLDQSGSGSFGDILSGVLWAADHGADVASMSIQGDFLKAGNGRLTAAINRVFDYAKAHGMLIVVAAGNSSANLDHNGNSTQTFCDAVHVICVSSIGPTTATGPVDVPSFFTNFGRSAISVAGPGGNADLASLPVSNWPWGPDIASWVWSLCSKTVIAGFDASGAPELTACAAGNRLEGDIGTSQATPHVAGLAALLVAAKGHGQPQLIKHLIESSADDLGAPGTDPFFGHGRINVAKAIGF